jgi:nucleoside-diphosphate-sugar epimerase
MKVLITGATGFVGTTLIPYLYNKGYTDLVLLVRNVQKAKRLFQGIPVQLIDTTNEWRDEVIQCNPDAAIHMATLFNGRCDAANAKAIVDTNILLTTQLLEALMHTDCQYFVNIGTFTEFFEGDGKFFPLICIPQVRRRFAPSSSIIRPSRSGNGLT